ncbi:hypothetical protein [Paraburkholderia sp.]|uniref:hypothetical protein n=1 Tax=Paraburkholderia sp. TaxID=1926495 RepID=UPI0023A0D4EE|nr:hypothetical protein [Paraburkholderia sp.]MDE1181574.1 hypothetical protein [Paraburkholderia sp.]
MNVNSLKVVKICTAVLISTIPFLSFAADGPLPKSFEASSTLQAEGIVESIDLAKSAVTVTDSNGSEASFVVTDSADLGKIRQGGKVHIRMMRNATVSFAHTQNTGSAQTVVAEVQDIDHQSGVLTLKPAHGPVFHIQTREPEKLSKIVRGTPVEINYAQQVNIAVSAAQ